MRYLSALPYTAREHRYRFSASLIMPFLIPDTRERQRLERKLTRTHEAYYNATTNSEREILWHRIQAQKTRLHEINNLEQWAMI